MHSVTEVNGAGVHTETWQTCDRCGISDYGYSWVPKKCRPKSPKVSAEQQA